jgi:LysR family glycine cleavage system transcriptional activator
VPASAYGRLPLNALRVFEAVATRLSFSEAADALNVTPAAVSQQIKALEEYLQIPVLRRSGRKVELTPEGAKLLPGVQSGLDALVATLRETRMQRASGIINISTLSSLLQKWVTPRLHRLHERFPQIRVDWHTSREAVDFARSDFHAAVRLGEAVTPGLEYDHLMDEWLVVVASPKLFKKFGALDERESLEGIPMLQARDEPW